MTSTFYEASPPTPLNALLSINAKTQDTTSYSLNDTQPNRDLRAYFKTPPFQAPGRSTQVSKEPANTKTLKNKMAPIMCSACICCYTALDPADIKLLLKNRSECLCISQDCCLAVGEDGYGLGLVTENDEICKIALVVCALGLKVPSTLISGAGHCLCIKQAQAIPFSNDYVGSPVCAWYVG